MYFFLTMTLDIYLLKNDQEKAVQLFKEFYPQHENDPVFMLYSSRFHCYMGEFEDAIQDLTKGIEIIKTQNELDAKQKEMTTNFYLARACLYAHLDDFSKARVDIEQSGIEDKRATEIYKGFQIGENHIDGYDFTYEKQDIVATRMSDGSVSIYFPCNFTLKKNTLSDNPAVALSPQNEDSNAQTHRK